MSRWHVWTFNLLTAVVSVSGVVYFWMKYVLVTDDPFSAVNHPWQPGVLKTHILAAPLFLLIFGMMAQSHIVNKLRNKSIRANRASGMVSLGSCLLMVISGYLLQVATAPVASRALLILHLASGVVFAGTYVTHQIIGLLTVKQYLQRPRKRDLAA